MRSGGQLTQTNDLQAAWKKFVGEGVRDDRDYGSCTTFAWNQLRARKETGNESVQSSDAGSQSQLGR